MAKQKRRSDCAVNVALELFGDRWTLLIVRDMLFRGKKYYGEFLQSEEKIATNILADRLALLESAGIVLKAVDAENRTRAIYRLTPKGIDLLPVLVDLIAWSAKYDANISNDKKLITAARRDREGLIREVSERLKG